MSTPPLRAAIWAAVSTQEQARSDKFSLAEQERRCRAIIQDRGWREVSAYIVRGQSRTKYIQLDQAAGEIEPLRRMLQDARAGKFDVLVLTEFDRLRELLDQVFRTLATCRVQLYSLGQPVDPVPPDEYSIYKADMIVMSISMSQAYSRMEIARTRRKWQEGMPKRITELGLPATSLAYGYRKPLDAKKDRRAVPEPDVTITKHILAIKDLCLAGHSTSELVDYLEVHQVPPPKSRRWHNQTVRDILRNPFYAGFVRFGASKVYVDPLTDKRKRNRQVAPEQVKINQGKHVPLWDLDTHRAILAELKRRAKNYRGRANNEFTGLVVCGICGCPMWRHGNGPRGEYRLMWRCSSTGSARGHNSVPHKELREKIVAELDKKLPPYLRQLDNAQEPREDTAGARKLLDELHLRLERLEDAYLAGQWDLNRYSERRESLDRQIAQAEAEIHDAEHQVDQRRVRLNRLKSMHELKNIRGYFADTDPTEINKTLHYLLKAITIGGVVEIEFH